MSTRTQLVVAIAVGQVVGLLGYIDPLFIPLVLAGPLVDGRCCRRPRHLDELLWSRSGSVRAST